MYRGSSSCSPGRRLFFFFSLSLPCCQRLEAPSDSSVPGTGVQTPLPTAANLRPKDPWPAQQVHSALKPLRCPSLFGVPDSGSGACSLSPDFLQSSSANQASSSRYGGTAMRQSGQRGGRGRTGETKRGRENGQRENGQREDGQRENGRTEGQQEKRVRDTSSIDITSTHSEANYGNLDMGNVHADYGVLLCTEYVQLAERTAIHAVLPPPPPSLPSVTSSHAPVLCQPASIGYETASPPPQDTYE